MCQSTRIANRLSLDRIADIFLFYRIVLADDRLAYDRRPHLSLRLTANKTVVFPAIDVWAIVQLRPPTRIDRQFVNDWFYLSPREYIRLIDGNATKVFYSFFETGERIGAEIPRTIIAWWNVTMKIIGRRTVVGSRNPYRNSEQ